MSSISIDHDADDIHRDRNGVPYRYVSWKPDASGKAKDFLMAPRPLLHDASVSLPARFIYMLILDESMRLGGGRVQFPYGKITRYTGIKHARTIKTYLDELADAGWLTIAGDEGRKSANTERWYTPTLPDMITYCEVLTEGYAAAAESRRQNLNLGLSTGEVGDSQEVKEVHQELNRHASNSDIQSIDTKYNKPYQVDNSSNAEGETSSDDSLTEGDSTDRSVRQDDHGIVPQHGDRPLEEDRFAVASRWKNEVAALPQEKLGHSPSPMSVSASLRSDRNLPSTAYGHASEIADAQDDKAYVEWEHAQLRLRVIALDTEAQDARARGDEEGYQRITEQVRALTDQLRQSRL